MKKWMNLFTAVAVISIVSWGCARTEPTDTVAATSPGDEDHGDHDHDGDDHAGHDHGDHDGHDQDGDDHAGHDHGETVLVALYCGDCGQGPYATTWHIPTAAKGGDHQCDSSREVCGECGFHKGSALCCKKIEGDFAGKSLCASCGQIAGTDACCKVDAAVCEKCGFHAGSPLCCKLGAKVEDAVAPAAPVDTPPAPAEPAPAADDASAAPAPTDLTPAPEAAPAPPAPADAP